MNKKTWVVIALGIGVASVAVAQPRDGFGIGIIVGEPTGLSLKKWMGNETALAAGFAWSFSENASLHFHADYLIHRFDFFKASDFPGRMPLYYGLGGRLKLRETGRGRGRNKDDAMIGVRVPLGISYLPADSPTDLFVEVVPILDLAPSSSFGLNAALGARYYF